MVNSIIKNIADIRAKIPAGVRIVAASKTRSADEINALLSAGITDFGENRVQEYLQKKAGINPALAFHFIGRLQTNKVKYIIGGVTLIQSLDRLALAAEIERQAAKIDRTADCLVEVNMGEAQKGGIPILDTAEFIQAAEQYPHIRIRGLMAVMPEGAAEANYLRLRDLYDKMREGKPDFDILSAGMSDDFETAVKHGSNMIRIGSLLFGKRLDEVKKHP
ncbi:MAG: YggS family pyridoxal phosphate-dependent enzyme [Firmicutes bacterium]|nr:YggS family pyridoxal phosphate-dependent enzyme [Bacillota bacterium]